MPPPRGDEHLFGRASCALRHEAAKHLIFFFVRSHALAIDLHGFRVEINPEVASLNNGLGVALERRQSRECGDQLILVNGSVRSVVRAEAQPANLLIDAAHAGKSENRCLDLVYAKRAQKPRIR